MKTIICICLFITSGLLLTDANAQTYNVPEILYYKFDNGSTTTPNLAVPGQGASMASVVNMTMGPPGQFGNALIGNAGTGTNTYVSSEWNMNVGTSDWTISLWINNFPSVTGTSYLFGNDITTSFRCFTNGAAGAGNITLRGNGITNINVTGVLPGPSVVHFVYDSSVPEVRTYVNGVFQNAVSQVAFNFNASVPFKVGSYGTANSIPVGAMIDEFRFYGRALGPAEIAGTWDQTLPVSSGNAIDPTTVCDYGLIPQYSAGALGGHASATLGDTLYIAGGSANPGNVTNPTASTLVTRYSINSGEWSLGRPLPTPKAGGDLVRCGNYLYYMGGGAVTLTGASDALAYRYSQDSGWTAIANIPTAVTGNVAESWGDSVIFCIMGGWTSYYRGIQIYRPASDQWSRANDSLPDTFGRRSFAGGIQGNKIFIAAGYSGTFRKDFWVGTIGNDAGNITWVQKDDVPLRGTGNSRPGGTAVNNRFYVVPGESTPAPIQQDSIYIWSVTDSMWLPQIITGRGAQTTSNYWGVISSSIIGNKVKIWIPGGFYPATITTTKLMVLTDSIGCLITGTGNTINSVLPDNFSLSQNYPNPFNPVTRIKYSVPFQSDVKIAVFNVLGKEVLTLVNEVKQAGDYILDINASDLTSGVYFYRLTATGGAGEFTDTKRMILLK